MQQRTPPSPTQYTFGGKGDMTKPPLFFANYSKLQFYFCEKYFDDSSGNRSLRIIKSFAAVLSFLSWFLLPLLLLLLLLLLLFCSHSCLSCFSSFISALTPTLLMALQLISICASIICNRLIFLDAHLSKLPLLLDHHIAMCLILFLLVPVLAHASAIHVPQTPSFSMMQLVSIHCLT